MTKSCRFEFEIGRSMLDYFHFICSICLPCLLNETLNFGPSQSPKNRVKLYTFIFFLSIFRPAFTTSKLINEGRNFGFSSFSPVWKAHRKIISNVLYSFGNTRNNPIEDMIRGEANVVVEEFLRHDGRSFCPLDSLQVR